MFLADVIDCEILQAINTGSIADDNVANMELYLKLLEDGKENHFSPVLLRKEKDFYRYLLRYCDVVKSKEDYIKVKDRLIEKSSHGCFDLWLGRIFYDYYLNDYLTEEDYWRLIRDIERFPDSDRYKEIISNASEQIQLGIFDDDEVRLSKRIDLGFDEFYFAKVPTDNPWEILAWIPMGGFNWCPPAEYHIVVARELFKEYGAQLMYVGYDTLKFYVKNPIMDQNGLNKLLKILRVVSPDIYPNYENTAKDIIGSNVWHLWWD